VRRREFIAKLGVAAAYLPAAARAEAALPVIGFLSGTSPVGYAPFAAAFREALAEAGIVEGRNVAIEYRWAEGVFDRLPALAEDLTRRKVDVLVTSGSTLAALAAKKATDTIPTVFITGDDPVAGGLVASLARPGGNRTGISFLVVDLNAKRFGLLCELVPQARRIGLIVNPLNAAVAARVLRDIGAAAAGKGIDLIALKAGSEAEIEAAFAALAKQHADALLIGNDAFFNSQRERFVALAAQGALPTCYESQEAVRGGGLIAYSASFTMMYRRLGEYTAKVLKGAKPADLPVQQPTKFELVINLKTAKALGLTVPPILLAQADEVIE
jgi:putative tryptophan/tyrosine transport system substrate-binding protein